MKYAYGYKEYTKLEREKKRKKEQTGIIKMFSKIIIENKK